MKNTIIIAAAVAACTLASGCYTTAGTSVVLDHESGDSLIYEGNTRLHNAVSVSGVTYDRTASGLNRANFQLTSCVQRELYLQYRITWYNQEGMEIDGEAKPYRQLRLEGMDSVTVSGVAPRPDAVKSRLRVREYRH